MRPRHLFRVEQLEERAVPATYFVSTAGANGNAGTTAGTAWQTLQHAANTVQPGDTVWVLPGSYAGFYLTAADSGTAAARIAFRGQGPGVNITSPNTQTNRDGINLEGASYITIEGFTVNGMNRTGIRTVDNKGVVIRNNSMDQNGYWGILTGFSEDVLIEYNTASRSTVEHGIYVSNTADRPVVRGNVCWGNRANGIHMNGDIDTQPAGGGADGIISNALVENNVLYGNGAGGGSGINCDGVQNSVFRNNLIYDSKASGISLYRINGGGPSSGNLVVNNTFWTRNADDPNSGAPRWAVNIQNGSVNNTVRNNVLFSAHPNRGAINVSADSLPGFASDYNAVENRFTTADGGNALTLAQWRTATGQDANSFVITDPSTLFVNAAAGDYHLRAGSAAINAGTAASAPLFDYEGTVRPTGGGIDIGHDEYTTVVAPSPPPRPVPPTTPKPRPHKPRRTHAAEAVGVYVAAHEFAHQVVKMAGFDLTDDRPGGGKRLRFGGDVG